MLKVRGDSDQQDIFKKRCALAAAGSLTQVELSELRAHLEGCEDCQEIYRQYRILTTQGMSTLADASGEGLEEAAWDNASVRERLLGRVSNDQQMALQRNRHVSAPVWPGLLRRVAANRLAGMLLAAGLILAVASGAYRLGLHKQTQAEVRTTSDLTQGSVQKRVQENAAGELSAAQTKKLAELQSESSAKQREIEKLQSALRAVEIRSSELATANGQSATNRDQERRLKDAEQYLTSDRDIRELMGARKLYIADVFDVDGSSRTKKPFGRVFYTQGKSLIFYAFDLDREPGVVNASTFQVWGQRETPQGEPASPMNLGILYMDNETNRRWVMRFDDPKQLTEIDAVFVTVEPRGGSHKPTSKPFLYALLRKEVNHP